MKTTAEAYADGLVDAQALELVLVVAADQAWSWAAAHSGEAPESPARTLLEHAYLNGLLAALHSETSTKDVTGDHR